MLYLNPKSRKIVEAKDEFLIKMRGFVLKQVEKQNEGSTELKKKIEDNLKIILIGLPDELICIDKKLKAEKSYNPELVKKIFRYDLFTNKTKRYSAYHLAEALDINTCTYCNRNYTTTVFTDKKEGKTTRPQFDHYFSKKDYPLLALSFFNLIPCCSICNLIKGRKQMRLCKHLHPYIDNSEKEFKFSYRLSTENKAGLKMKIKSAKYSKAENTIEDLKLEVVYNSNISELDDLIKLRRYFSDRYLSILGDNLLKGIDISKEEMYRIVFGAEYKPEKFLQRPFSKFKKDILTELGIIED